jgi:UDP-N-acetyl-D-glucosamine/UDP-N-acetyl-D-galactosamine dehydrogenase
VGGHCIGVDPYYLTHKAERHGYHPQVILAGRRINDGMGKFIAEKTVKMMIRAGQNVRGARIGILGLTFKEDCPDLRNTRVIDIVTELASYGIQVMVHDPQADAKEAEMFYGIRLCRWDELERLNALILAVPHREYRTKPFHELSPKLSEKGCFIDVKSVFSEDEVAAFGIDTWRL